MTMEWTPGLTKPRFLCEIFCSSCLIPFATAVALWLLFRDNSKLTKILWNFGFCYASLSCVNRLAGWSSLSTCCWLYSISYFSCHLLWYMRGRSHRWQFNLLRGRLLRKLQSAYFGAKSAGDKHRHWVSCWMSIVVTDSCLPFEKENCIVIVDSIFFPLEEN